MREQSTGLLRRLRSPATVFYEYASDDGALLREAADRIEALEAAIVEFVDADSWAFEQHAVNPNDQEPGERVAAAKAALRRLVGRELREEATK